MAGAVTGGVAVSVREMRLISYLAFAGFIVPAAAQNTSEQFRPEVEIYLKLAESIRIEFDTFVTGTQSTHAWQGNFAFYVDAALKPVFRRNLREDPDVYRNRYLTMRAGYLYHTSLANASSSGNIGILELTSRYRLPLALVISDRNRGEFRFFKGESFYTRYRNRLRMEREVSRGHFVCIPYAYDEIFYDTRYGEVTPNRYGFGAQFPAGRHMIFDPYYMRQNGSRSHPPHINAIGFRWNIYF